MVSPHHIKYAGISSDELNMLDLIMDVAIDGDDGETNTYLNRSAIQSESHDGRYKPTVRYKFDEVFAPKFTFIKKNFEDFSIDEVRLLLKYLTSKDTTALLEAFYDDSNVVSWAAIGGWTEINLQKLANNRTIGVTAVFSSVHPFALSDIYTITKRISSLDNNTITINIDTDDNKPVYPRITINHGYGGVPHTIVRIPDGTVYTETTDMVPNTVYYNGSTYYWKTSGRTSATAKPTYGWDEVEVDHVITNSDVMEENTIYYYVNPTTNIRTYYWIEPYYFHKQDGGEAPTLATTSVRFTNTHTDFFNQTKPLPSVIVKNNNSTEKVVLDGANKIVSSSSVRRVFGDDFNWQWLELYDGKNEITVEGNCEVTLEWRTVIKCGEF